MLVLEQTDRRVRRPEELQELFDLPVIGTIPESSMINNGGPPQPEDWRSAEAFRMFRASLLYFDAGREIKSVLVTSAAPGDGKTTVALGLAVAAAEPGLSVLLVEADLRRPTLGRPAGPEARWGPDEGAAQQGSELDGHRHPERHGRISLERRPPW